MRLDTLDSRGGIDCYCRLVHVPFLRIIHCFVDFFPLTHRSRRRAILLGFILGSSQPHESIEHGARMRKDAGYRATGYRLQWVPAVGRARSWRPAPGSGPHLPEKSVLAASLRPPWWQRVLVGLHPMVHPEIETSYRVVLVKNFKALNQNHCY